MGRERVVAFDVLVLPIHRDVSESIRAQAVIVGVEVDLGDHPKCADRKAVSSHLFLQGEAPVRRGPLNDVVCGHAGPQRSEQAFLGGPIQGKLGVDEVVPQAIEADASHLARQGHIDHRPRRHHRDRIGVGKAPGRGTVVDVRERGIIVERGAVHQFLADGRRVRVSGIEHLHAPTTVNAAVVVLDQGAGFLRDLAAVVDPGCLNNHLPIARKTVGHRTGSLRVAGAGARYLQES